MVKEGYLVKYESHKDGVMAEIVYAKFEHGVLRFFTQKNGKWVGEFQVSGKSSKVELLPDSRDRLPHRFCITTHEIVAKDDALYYGASKYVEFSASCGQQQLAWGNTVHLWKRNFWREMSLSKQEQSRKSAGKELTHETEYGMLRKAIERKGLKSNSLRSEKLARKSSYRPIAVTFALPPNPMGMSPMTLQQPSAVQTLAVA